MAICSVQEFGICIPKDQQDKIFQKFYRLTRKNDHTFPQMGLGLRLVKDIIAGHPGKTGFEGEEGKGATFCFRIISGQRSFLRRANYSFSHIWCHQHCEPR
jgi:signal transduction histidine kinase